MCVKPSIMAPVRLADGTVTYRYFPPNADVRPLIDRETGEYFEPFEIGCGKCLECINLHKLQWTHRLLDELKCHKHAMFLTLTYRPAPDFDGDLHPDHVQKFIKRFRKEVEPLRIRYYLCGEYGSKGYRPHYHVIIYGCTLGDSVPYKRDKKGFLMSRSPTLEKLWPYGFSSILPANEITFGYVTKDMQKLLPLAKGRQQPFVRMSTHPGIGALGWNRSLTDGKVWHNGKSCPLPRYYKKIAEREQLPGYSDMLRKMIVFNQNREPLNDYAQKKRVNDKKLRDLLK